MKSAYFSTKDPSRGLLRATIANVTEFEATGRCGNQLMAK